MDSDKKPYHYDETMSALGLILFSGGGMDTLLLCLKDIVEDVIEHCREDEDTEYLEVLRSNLLKTYNDYCERHKDAQGR